MVSASNFEMSIKFLEGLTTKGPTSLYFDGEYREQHPIKIAVQLLHLVATEGSVEQKDTLYARKAQIKDLNKLLKSSEHFQTVIKTQFNLSNEVDISGMQVSLPKNRFQRMLATVLKIPGFVLAILGDIVMLPGAGILILLELMKKDFNPTKEHVKKDKTPILLLHGSGYCQAQWLPVRPFLKGKDFGSVFSCSYAEGLMSNDPKSGIGKYSAEKVREQIQEIKKITGQNKLIIIGHSMGTAVGEYYAQHYAEEDGVKVTNVLSFSTPWQGSPTIDFLRLRAKRYQEMSKSSGDEEHLKFRKQLLANARIAEIKGERLHWNMWSEHDCAVPGKAGRLTDDPRRQYKVWGVGHYLPMVHWGMLIKMRSWVKQMYAMEKVFHQKREDDF